MFPIYLKNFRRGLATNSSSTHSVIYRNDGEVFKDMNIFELNYYDRHTKTIAASREAKIKYVLATVFYNDKLTEILSQYYPEMRQYYPLVKKRMEEIGNDYYEAFGMYTRGRFDFGNMDLSLEASIDYCRSIIDNPEIVIVGGSDEEGWVFDVANGHLHYPEPDNWIFADKISYEDNIITKNGNYYVAFGYMNYPRLNKEKDEEEDEIRYTERGRIRFMTYGNEEPVPEFPELVDLKITNKCSNGCKFCFMSSTPGGKHADIKFLKNIINQFGTPGRKNYHRVEFSIGGGNVLEYPELDALFSYMKQKGHVINITINAKDIETIKNNNILFNTIDRYVDGIGISVLDVADLKPANELDVKLLENKKHVVLHLIPEYLGFAKTKEIIMKANEMRREWKNSGSYNWLPSILFLGFKQMGRANNTSVNRLTDDELYSLFSFNNGLSIDTTFAKTYEDWIKANMSYKYSITWNEGEYSMFIDGVKRYAYKSSYQLDKPYSMSWENKDGSVYGVKEAFGKIREDGGFPKYEFEHEKYWNNVR